MEKTQPLSVIPNQLRNLDIFSPGELNGSEYERIYGDATLYGDIQNIYANALSARGKRTQETQESDYRVNSKEIRYRPDLLSAELSDLIDVAERALEKVEASKRDPDGLRTVLTRTVIPTLNEHKELAEQGKVMANGEIYNEDVDELPFDIQKG